MELLMIVLVLQVWMQSKQALMISLIVSASEAAMAQEVPPNFALWHTKLALVSPLILAVPALLAALQWVICPILSASQVALALVVRVSLTSQHMQ